MVSLLFFLGLQILFPSVCFMLRKDVVDGLVIATARVSPLSNLLLFFLVQLPIWGLA